MVYRTVQQLEKYRNERELKVRIAESRRSATYFVLIGRSHGELRRFTARSLPLGSETK